MVKIGKLRIWFILIIGLRVCQSRVLLFSQNKKVNANSSSKEVFYGNASSSTDSFHEGSISNSVFHTESPKHHQVKRSVLLYKQNMLKIEAPDAPIYIHTGYQGDIKDDSSMPALILKNPVHSGKNFPWAVNSEHVANVDQYPDLHVMSQKDSNGNPVNSENEENPNSLELKNGEVSRELKHPVPVGKRFLSPETAPRPNEPVPDSLDPAGLQSAVLDRNEKDTGSSIHKTEIVNGQRFIKEGIADAVKTSENQRNGDNAKRFDSIEKETGFRKLIENSDTSKPLRQSLNPDENENTNVIPNSLKEPTPDSTQDLDDRVMSFQSVQLIKNSSWIIPSIERKNFTSIQDIESRSFGQVVYSKLPVPTPPKTLTSGYETNELDTKDDIVFTAGYGANEVDSAEDWPKTDANVHTRSEDNNFLAPFTEKTEIRFDDDGNLLYIKKQLLEIFVPQFLLNYTTDQHDGVSNQFDEPYEPAQSILTNNPLNRKERYDMKIVSQNRQDKAFFIKRYLNKRRANRDIKATFWHHRVLQKKRNTSSPKPI